MSGRCVVLAVAGIAGAALAFAAWPRFIAGAVVAPYEDLPRSFARNEKVAPEVIARGAEAARVSLLWQDRPETQALSGALSFVAGRRADTAAAQRAALDRTIAALRRSLARAPAQPYAWLLLAQALRARDGITAALDEPLRRSLRFAPWEHRLVMPRVEIALAAWPVISPGLRTSIAGQIRRAVDTAPVALAHAARRHFALRQVRAALASSPVHLRRFEIVYLSPD